MDWRKLAHYQCVTSVYEFLNEIEQIRLQMLNRRHYRQIIPGLRYYIYLNSQKLVSFPFQTLRILYLSHRKTRY